MNRKINIKLVATTLMLGIVTLSSMAQVNKQVEVTKTYIPKIETATKLHIEPDMSDTVRLEPEIDYSVEPRSIETTLSSTLYKPATVTYWEFNRPKRGYVKAGLGYPLSSVADVYVSNSNPNINYIVGYLNHEGKYGKLENDYGDNLSALRSQNRAGIAAGRKFVERTLEGEFRYDIDTWSRYATLNSITPRSLYQTLSLEGRYGDDFVDLSKWNFNLDLDAKYFWGRNNNNNTQIGGGVNLGGDLPNGRLLFELGYDYILGSNDYLNSSLLLGATYQFSTGVWDLLVGGEYYMDGVSIDSSVNNRNYILPHFKVKNSSKVSIQPFLEIDGDLIRYNYCSLVDQNPYVLEGFTTNENGVKYNICLGIEGVSDNKKFSYRLFGDYSITQNALFWTLNEVQTDATNISNYYTAQLGDLCAFAIGGDLEYTPMGDLKFNLGASLYDYKSSGVDGVSTAKPYSKAYFKGEYMVGRVRFGASADLNGVSYTTLYVTDDLSQTSRSSIQTSTNVNIKAFAEVELNNKMVLFVEGDNLANSKIYEWMGYREYGIGAIAGVKFQF